MWWTHQMNAFLTWTLMGKDSVLRSLIRIRRAFVNGWKQDSHWQLSRRKMYGNNIFSPLFQCSCNILLSLMSSTDITEKETSAKKCWALGPLFRHWTAWRNWKACCRPLHLPAADDSVFLSACWLCANLTVSEVLRCCCSGKQTLFCRTVCQKKLLLHPWQKETNDREETLFENPVKSSARKRAFLNCAILNSLLRQTKTWWSQKELSETAGTFTLLILAHQINTDTHNFPENINSMTRVFCVNRLWTLRSLKSK